MQLKCTYCGKMQRPLREQVLYLLKELGFDCMILQGNATPDLPLDAAIVVQNFKQQLLAMHAKHTANQASRIATATLRALAQQNRATVDTESKGG